MTTTSRFNSCEKHRLKPTEFVSIIMPVRNEGKFIKACLRGILDQTYQKENMEILIADGMSDDSTRSQVLTLAEEDNRIRLLDNMGRFVSSGLNAAIRQARGDIIVRMDAHTEYAPNYIEECVRVLKETGADCVGGPWKAKGQTYRQKAIALAFHSPFSSGGASSHAIHHEGEVDSVYLGCWRRATLIQLGGFDEDLIRNQDDELNFRLIRSGGRVWQSSSIRSCYYPRSSLCALFRQYMQYGYWKVRVIQKHKMPASIRHLVPGVFVATLLILAGFFPWLPMARMALAGLLAAYGMASTIAALLIAWQDRELALLPILPLVFWAYHLGYGYGFLRGLIDFGFKAKQAPETFRALTRA